MHTIRRPLIVFFGVSILGAAAACGSSSNGNTSTGQSSDSGMEDSSAPDSTGGMDSPQGDAVTGGEGGHDGSPSSDAGDGGTGTCPPFDAGNPFVEAPHGPLPTVAYYGGPVMTSPLIVTFTFQDTPSVAAIDAFGQSIASSYWFSQVTKDYCIPDGGACITSGPPGLSVAIPMNADATYVDTFGTGPDDGGLGGTDLNLFMNQQIAAAVAANQIPAPTANTLYEFYFPATTTIQAFGPSCGWGGYHSAQLYSDGTTPIVYAVVADCSTGDPVADLQGIEITASHEIAEAVTDPATNGTTSWYMDQWGGGDAGITVPEYRNDPWFSLLFGEVGDNCESIALQTWPLDDAGAIAQRIWSISAASEGHNPCIPVPAGESYYNASTDKAIYVASVGQTFTVDVSAFSDAARASWRLDAYDATQNETGLTDDAGAPLQYLKLEWVGGVMQPDGTPSLPCANNGTTGQLNVTLLADPSNDMTLAQQQEWPEADGLVQSTDVAAPPMSFPGPDGGPQLVYPFQFWPFAVITPAVAAQLGVPSSGIADMVRVRALRAAHHAQKARHAATRFP